ncbi:MAG: hypothetical protein LBL66_04800 [Clostridiales bacterium]|jgi:hypothetical protein|nr:hypothetical protein [Clostridiales bacterium]
MKALQEIQTVLDRCLLPLGILSGHIRRNNGDARAAGGAIDKDAYATYRMASSENRVYGNGKPLLRRVVFDVNYYYKNEDNNNAEAVAAAGVADGIEKAFKAAGWSVVGGLADLYDSDTGFLGFNIEVAKTEGA